MENKLKYVLDKAHELIDFTDYYDLFAKYDTLTKISFDYAVVEKEDKIESTPIPVEEPKIEEVQKTEEKPVIKEQGVKEVQKTVEPKV